MVVDQISALRMISGEAVGSGNDRHPNAARERAVKGDTRRPLRP